jgi:hypothetical protein
MAGKAAPIEDPRGHRIGALDGLLMNNNGLRGEEQNAVSDDWVVVVDSEIASAVGVVWRSQFWQRRRPASSASGPYTFAPESEQLESARLKHQKRGRSGSNEATESD